MSECGVVIKDDGVVIYLDYEGAWWLADSLPQKDGFTREVWAAVRELETAAALNKEEK